MILKDPQLFSISICMYNKYTLRGHVGYKRVAGTPRRCLVGSLYDRIARTAFSGEKLKLVALPVVL